MNVNIVKDGEYEFNNFIYITQKSLDENCCSEIIRLFEHSTKTFKGTTLNGVSENVKQSRDLHMMMDKDVFKDIDKLLYDQLNKHLYKYIEITNQHCFTLPVKEFTDSGFQIQKYVKNTGYYRYHNDESIRHTNNDYRILTYIWYLNNVEIGGETEFGGNVKIKPETGKLVLFPASWTFPHCGLMPIDNDKYIVTGWIYSKY